MKHISCFIAFSVFILGISSCKKSDNGNGTPTGTNTWRLNGNTQTITSVTRAALGSTGAQGLYGTTANGDFVVFSFGYYSGSYFPTSGGVYTINANTVQTPTQGTCDLSIYSNSTSHIYELQHAASVKATVTVSGGKVRISVPDIYVASIADPNDSTLFSVSLTEQ